MKRKDLQKQLEDLAAEEEFWLTHLYLRLQSLDSATNPSLPSIFS